MNKPTLIIAALLTLGCGKAKPPVALPTPPEASPSPTPEDEAVSNAASGCTQNLPGVTGVIVRDQEGKGILYKRHGDKFNRDREIDE